jgi:hypothetical protein
VFGLLGLGALAFVGIAVMGLLASVVALVCWVFVFPFRLLGFVFRGFAGLLALPFLLLFGLLGVVLFAAGMVAFLVPVLPFVVIVALVVWLMRHRHPDTPRTGAVS